MVQSNTTEGLARTLNCYNLDLQIPHLPQCSNLIKPKRQMHTFEHESLISVEDLQILSLPIANFLPIWIPPMIRTVIHCFTVIDCKRPTCPPPKNHFSLGNGIFELQVADADIIFLPCSLLCLSFFPSLISAVSDWMSTILPHMVWS